jgi:hypothetical protein
VLPLAGFASEGRFVRSPFPSLSPRLRALISPQASLLQTLSSQPTNLDIMHVHSRKRSKSMITNRRKHRGDELHRQDNELTPFASEHLVVAIQAYYRFLNPTTACFRIWQERRLRNSFQDFVFFGRQTCQARSPSYVNNNNHAYRCSASSPNPQQSCHGFVSATGWSFLARHDFVMTETRRFLDLGLLTSPRLWAEMALVKFAIPI